jgi:hypothetical protein
MKGSKKKPKAKRIREKAATLETGKAPAYGCCPGRFGTLGRFEGKEGADEGACT